MNMSAMSSQEDGGSGRALTPGSILIMVTSLMLFVYALVLYKPWQLFKGEFTFLTALQVAQPIVALFTLILGGVCLFWWWKAGRLMSFIVLGVGGINLLLWVVQAILGVQGLETSTATDVVLYLLRDIFPPLVLTGGIAVGALLNILNVGTPEPLESIPDVLQPAEPPPFVEAPTAPLPPQPSPIVPPSAQQGPIAPKAWLQIQMQGAQVSTVPVQDGLLIGRAQEADVLLTHSSVSRRHAVIRYAQGRFFIQDQGSANGTYVNGRRVAATALKDGDRIRIGTVELVFRQT